MNGKRQNMEMNKEDEGYLELSSYILLLNTPAAVLSVIGFSGKILQEDNV